VLTTFIPLGAFLYLLHISVNAIDVFTYVILDHKFATCFGSSFNHKADISLKSAVVAMHDILFGQNTIKYKH
jgi:hypothetical protein